MSHDPHAHAPTPEVFDEMDPHGYEQGHGQHKSHVIVGPFTLRSVLAVLLVLTVLTVGQAQAEVYIQHALDIDLPKWINVAVVMTIAAIKALLVMGFFMQLKYDNPINAIAMAFCFFALCLFLGFTGLDLFNRGTVYEFKAGQTVRGGTGGANAIGGLPPVQGARERWAQIWGPEKFAEVEHEILSHGHAAHAAAAHDTGSSDQRSRPKAGLSGALDTAPAPAAPTTPAHGEHAEH